MQIQSVISQSHTLNRVRHYIIYPQRSTDNRYIRQFSTEPNYISWPEEYSGL